MKASNSLLAVWLAVVGALVFLAVYVLLRDPAQPNAGASGNDVNGPLVPVPDPNAGGDEGPDGTGRRKPPRKTSRRAKPHILGRVFGPDGTPVVGADISVAITGLAPPVPETARETEIRFINSVIYVEPEDWNRPRPLGLVAHGPAAAAAPPPAFEVAQGTSGDDGRFDFELPLSAGLGPFRLAAKRDGIGKASAAGVRAGAEVELTLGPPVHLKGIIISGHDGTPVPDATLFLTDGELRFSGKTGADGAFKLEGVEPGIFSATVTAQGHPPLLNAQVTVKLDSDLELRMPRGTVVRVTTLLEGELDDVPLADVEVAIMEETSYAYVLGKSDLNGVVEFKGLPPGDYIVNGRGKAAISFGEEQVILDGDELMQEVELLMEPAVPTVVTIVDPDRRPVAGMTFYSGNQDEEYDALRSERLPGESDAAGQYSFAFEFEGPRAMIFGFKKGFSMVRVYPDDHDTGEPVTIVTRPGLRVHGTVMTPDGKPVPDAVIGIEITPEDDDMEEMLVQIRSGSDGGYDFPYVPRGEVWIYAELEDAWTEEIELEVVEGKTDYRIDLEMELE